MILLPSAAAFAAPAWPVTARLGAPSVASARVEGPRGQTNRWDSAATAAGVVLGSLGLVGQRQSRIRSSAGGWGKGAQNATFAKLKGIDTTCKVWVCGLPDGATWKELEKHFEENGGGKPSISEIMSKGTGVCAFGTAEEANAAIAVVNGTQFKGSVIQVDVWTKSEGGGNDGKWTLIEKIKDMQRSDAELKAKWWAFTDKHHAGVHDPRKLDKAVLEEFLSTNPYQGGDGKWVLVDKIKNQQRTDADAKAKWWAFTDEQHGGVHDPKKHDQAVLEQFLSTNGYS